MLNTHKHSAVIVLPRGALAAVSASPMASWLSRGDVAMFKRQQDTLSRLASLLVGDAESAGSAALRLWGQTGRRPTEWIAAADPVFFEARLDHLCLHSVERAHILGDADELFACLDRRLGDGPSLAFQQVEGLGYLRADRPLFATASRSAESLDATEPSPYMPTGPESGDYHRLQSEIQMMMHDLPLQERRAAAGGVPINGLWLWGGGYAPGPVQRSLPPLYGGDDVLRGYWFSSMADVHEWPGSLAECAEAAGSFVTALPAGESLVERLEEARRLLNSRRLRRVTWLFAESLEVTFSRAHRFRVWRSARGLQPAVSPAS